VSQRPCGRATCIVNTDTCNANAMLDHAIACSAELSCLSGQGECVRTIAESAPTSKIFSQEAV